jgi:hypothetical protein
LSGFAKLAFPGTFPNYKTGILAGNALAVEHPPAIFWKLPSYGLVPAQSPRFLTMGCARMARLAKRSGWGKMPVLEGVILSAALIATLSKKA